MVLKLHFEVSKHFININTWTHHLWCSSGNESKKMQPEQKKDCHFKYSQRNLNQEEWASKREGKTELLQNEVMSRVLTSFLPNGQCCDIRSDIKQQICPLQYLLHRPWRWSILDFCTGEWRSWAHPKPVCQNCLLSFTTAEHKTKRRVCNCLLLVNSTTNLYSSIKEYANGSKYYGHVHLFLITKCM